MAATNNVAYAYDNTAGSATYGLLLSVSDSGPLAAYTGKIRQQYRDCGRASFTYVLTQA